jgi:hypothetical protein
VEAGIGGDPVLPSSTAITSAGTGCSEQQEAGPQEETASASPRDRPVEGTIRSVAEDAECVRLERVSVVVEENALAGVVDADKAEPVVRETEGNALAGVADMDKVEPGVREAEGNALAGEVDAESTESRERGPTDGENRTTGTGPTGRYDCLFTDKELDELELGNDGAARAEPEVTDKEIEERLFPLEEKQIQSRVTWNAEGHEKPTLAEMSAVLGITVGVSERTKDVSSGTLAKPAYWMNWCAETLETSVEAKRASRNFRERTEAIDALPHVANVVAVVSNGEESSAVEREVARNVCVGFEDAELPPTVGEDGRGTIALTWRSMVRRRIYELLTAEVDGEKSRGDCRLETQEGEGAEGEAPPERDKNGLSPLDKEALRAYIVEANGNMSEAFQKRAIAWARQYYGQEARSIIDKLRVRRRKPLKRGEAAVATVGSSMRVAFQDLMSDSEEERNAEISREVDSVKVSEVPRRKKPPGLRVADIDTGVTVPDGRRMTTSTRNNVGTSVEVGEPPDVGTRGERHRGAFIKVGEPAGFRTSGTRSESVVEAVAVKTANVPAVGLPFEPQLWNGAVLTLLEASWWATLAVQGVYVAAVTLVTNCYSLLLRRVEERLSGTTVMRSRVADQEWSELKARGEVERAGWERAGGKHVDVE